jgi:3-(3-hydroxy-phenyl)propionate hydroxylase
MTSERHDPSFFGQTPPSERRLTDGPGTYRGGPCRASKSRIREPHSSLLCRAWPHISYWDDADNLAWKLAFVVKGLASERLLDSYSVERVAATHENLSYGTKSTEFMAPPSFAFDLMRKAVLSLAVRHPALSSLINPRQTSAITYLTSPLNVVERAGEFECGPVPGQSLPECPVTIVEKGAARERHLTDLITPAVTAIYFADHGTAPPALIELAVRMRELGVPFVVTTLTRHLFVDVLEKHGWDHSGRLFDMFGATPGTLYIVRPDGHVLGRWRPFDAEAARAAIDHMLNF